MILISKESMKAVTVTSFKVVSDLSNAAEKDIEAIKSRIGKEVYYHLDLSDMQARAKEEIEAYLERNDKAYVHYLTVNGETFGNFYGKENYGKELFNKICGAIEMNLAVCYL